MNDFLFDAIQIPSNGSAQGTVYHVCNTLKTLDADAGAAHLARLLEALPNHELILEDEGLACDVEPLLKAIASAGVDRIDVLSADELTTEQATGLEFKSTKVVARVISRAGKVTLSPSAWNAGTSHGCQELRKFIILLDQLQLCAKVCYLSECGTHLVRVEEPVDIETAHAICQIGNGSSASESLFRQLRAHFSMPR